MSVDTVEFAKAYASKGWQIFPLKPHEKTPIVKWADVATAEENMVVGWFETSPDANIGIACGKRSGIVVIDIDARHGGFESLQVLQEQYGRLPETPIAKTGGGGEHIFFEHPGIEIRNSASRLAPGIDVRGDGGYVVGAGSIHPNGNHYEWVVKPSQVPLAKMPEWMIATLRDTSPSALPVSSNGIVANGSRNTYLTQMAGSMRRKGFSEDAMYQALLVDNREKCSPPLSDGEVLVIARSISRYTPKDEPQIAQQQTKTPITVIEEIEAEIREREKNPVDVWGIHYAWPYLSLVTGGKQLGELIILAGEPKIGKSWWAHQDALFTAIGNPKSIPETPTGIWSGEMKVKQVYRRMIDMLGVPKRHMLTGNMSETDWTFFRDAKSIISNSPVYVYDNPLDLKDLEEFLKRGFDDYGIVDWVIDYDWLISAPGENEIQSSQNISRTCKQLVQKLNISMILISSVNKMGMDTLSQNVSKSNISGSGKKLHDADVIYIMTNFNSEKNKDLTILPSEYDKIRTLHISVGRDMDIHVPGGFINYKREPNSPKFGEMKDATQKPGWIEPDTRRADIFGS